MANSMRWKKITGINDNRLKIIELAEESLRNDHFALHRVMLRSDYISKVGM